MINVNCWAKLVTYAKTCSPIRKVVHITIIDGTSTLAPLAAILSDTCFGVLSLRDLIPSLLSSPMGFPSLSVMMRLKLKEDDAASSTETSAASPIPTSSGPNKPAILT